MTEAISFYDQFEKQVQADVQKVHLTSGTRHLRLDLSNRKLITLNFLVPLEGTDLTSFETKLPINKLEAGEHLDLLSDNALDGDTVCKILNTHFTATCGVPGSWFFDTENKALWLISNQMFVLVLDETDVPNVDVIH